MTTEHDLRAAGRRAATQPVTPPPFSAIEAAAGRHRRRRRMLGGGALAVLLLAVGVPLGVVLRDLTGTQAVTAAGSSGSPNALAGGFDEGSEPDAGENPDDESPAEDAESPTVDDDSGTDPPDHDHDAHFRIVLGDDSFSVRVVSGDDAAEAATDAQAAADETRTIDGVDVWLRRDGEDQVASALVDGRFVEVSGDPAFVEPLVPMIAAGGPLVSPDGNGFGFGHFGDGFPFGDDFPFDGPPFDEGFPFGDDFPFGEWDLGPGSDHHFPERWAELEERLRERFEDFELPEELLDGLPSAGFFFSDAGSGGSFGFGFDLDGSSGCVRIEIAGADDHVEHSFPEGCEDADG